MRGGTAEKETKGGRERGRGREKVVVHSSVCVLQKKSGRQGERGRKERGSLKHCLYAAKFWTTLVTSKCFDEPGAAVAWMDGGVSGDLIHSCAARGVRDNVNTLITPNDLFP